MVDVGQGGIDGATDGIGLGEFPHAKLVCMLPHSSLGVVSNQPVAEHAVHHVHIELDALEKMGEELA